MYIYIYMHRVSQEEWTKLREGVPYVKLYRYNPKHLCPKLNGYWDNGQIKLWTSFVSTNDSCQLFTLIYICSPVRHTNCWCSPEMHIPAYVRQQSDKPGDIIAQHSSVMYSTSNPMYYYRSARNFAVQINGFMSVTSYFDVKYRY